VALGEVEEHARARHPRLIWRASQRWKWHVVVPHGSSGRSPQWRRRLRHDAVALHRTRDLPHELAGHQVHVGAQLYGAGRRWHGVLHHHRRLAHRAAAAAPARCRRLRPVPHRRLTAPHGTVARPGAARVRCRPKCRRGLGARVQRRTRRAGTTHIALEMSHNALEWFGLRARVSNSSPLHHFCSRAEVPYLMRTVTSGLT